MRNDVILEWFLHWCVSKVRLGLVLFVVQVVLEIILEFNSKVGLVLLNEVSRDKWKAIILV